ncbi:MAG: TadE/TadG family type IV pilus assembly protein [Armatimonadota bacterium]|nr:pilus assembly protein [bacterium]
MTVTGLSKRQWARSRRGAAMVEMALVIPMLLVLVFGMIEIGLMIKDSHALNGLAREVARKYAVGEIPSDSEIQTDFGLDENDDNKVNVDVKMGFVGEDGNVAWENYDQSKAIACKSEIKVTLTYDHEIIVWGNSTKTLSASIVMLQE